MKAVIQRVKNASVAVKGKNVGKCGGGVMVLFGPEKGDTGGGAGLVGQKTAGFWLFWV